MAASQPDQVVRDHLRLVGAEGTPRPSLLVCLDLQRSAISRQGEREGAAAGLGRETREGLSNCRRVLAHAREQDWSIVHVHRKGRTDGGMSRPIERLEPRPTEPVMTRDGPSAFACRHFRDLLRGADRVQLILIGFGWTTSCLATVFAARDRGMGVVVVEDAMGEESEPADDEGRAQAAARILARRFARMATTDSMVGNPTLRLAASR